MFRHEGAISTPVVWQLAIGGDPWERIMRQGG
jgi:hypothetical protein